MTEYPTGENCSSGCVTRDHVNLGECLRAKHLSVMWLGGTGPSYRDQKRWSNDTETYRQVVRDGGSLSTAMNKGVDVAYREIGKG